MIDIAFVERSTKSCALIDSHIVVKLINRIRELEAGLTEAADMAQKGYGDDQDHDVEAGLGSLRALVAKGIP